MKLSDFFESNYRIRVLRGKSANTVRLYRCSIRLLEKTLGREATIEDLTDDNVALVMQGVLDRKGSPFTANKERSQLLAIWRHAARTGHLKLWPTIQAEREPERIPTAWLRDDVQQLLDGISRLDGFIGIAPASLWWKCLVKTCLDTGERIGAVMQSEWNWIDRGSWLFIPAEARKFRKRDRRYLLSEDCAEDLMELKKFTGCDRLIFHWPYNYTYLWTKYKKVLKDIGLPHGPKDSFHKIRKTCGSVAHAAGLDVQEVLDHESRRTSKKYLDPRFTRKTEASEVLTNWLRTPPAEEKRKQA